MRKSLEHILKTKHLRRILIISLLIITAIGAYIYTNTFYVTVRFKELGPVSKNMAAYYNGFRIGKITKVKPDKDFKNILVRVNLTVKNLNLPQNTSVHVKNFPSGELYLQFVYPQTPALKKLRRGEVLEGISPYQLEEFMLGQNISGVTDIVSVHVLRALEAMEVANMEMKMFFQTTSTLMEENKKEINLSAQNITKMTNSLAQAAENLNQATAKINNAIDTEVIKDSTLGIRDSALNMKASTKNINDMSQNIKKATKNIDQTMKKIDNTIAHANCTAQKINFMTTELNKVLSKRFAGFRLMFGKPINSKP